MNFNTSAVAKVAGLSGRQIDYWDRSHFIKPSVRDAAGQGSTRLYSFNDLIQMKVAKTLLDKGISLQKIRKAVWYLKKNMPNVDKPLSDLKFITDGETIFVLTKDSRVVIDTLRHGQLMFSVALGSIIEELKGEVKILHDRRKYKVRVMGKRYPVVVHADTEDGGFWVECTDIPGCASQGDTLEEALTMIEDAIEGCLQIPAGKQKIKRLL
ncbi:MAG: MerR family transcriptional regulator [Syntrophales bacterium]|jgi:predicted RNase H-like HicB family nuclease